MNACSGRLSPNNAPRMAEVDTAKHRMTAWRASLRKDKKTTALQMDEEEGGASLVGLGTVVEMDESKCARCCVAL